MYDYVFNLPSCYFYYDEFKQAVEITEKDNEVVVEVEVPGFKKDQIDISIRGSVIYIHAKKKGKEFTKFKKLPAKVEVSRSSATLEDGVLIVTLPKEESAKNQKIVIT
jgi:HSP20 family protein